MTDRPSERAAREAPFDSEEQRSHSSGVYAATPDRRTAAETMVRLLCESGMNVFFGVPGGPIIPFFDAILEHPEATLVEPRHETHGIFAAIGFHRASGKVPVVAVTAGPGVTNSVTGVVAAHTERVPMILVCGDVPWAATGKRLAQQTGGDGIGVERIFAGITRAVVRIARGESAAAQLSTAIAAATRADDPGPVLVVLSVDRAGSSVRSPVLHGVHESSVPPPKQPPAAVLEQVANRLKNARRPLIVVGGGCRGHESSVLRLVERSGALFMTTPQAKGLLPEVHPLSLRCCGLGASWWARRYTRAKTDVVVALGTDLDDSSMAGTPPLGEGGFLAHVDRDANVIGRNFPTAMGLVYDVGVFAERLSAVCEKNPRSDALIADKLVGSPFDHPTFMIDEADPIAPHRVIADLERAASADTTFVSDIGEHMLFALHYLTANSPDRFVIHLGLGSMGSGIGSAIGLALAKPTRPVVCICGDGGMEMAGTELLMAVKHRLPVVYAVFNDARYNMVFHGYRYTYGREAQWSTPQVDFAAWAHALGARAARIDRPGQITRALLASLTEGPSPAVLDIRHDPSIRIQGDGRIEAIQQMSIMHE